MKKVAFIIFFIHIALFGVCDDKVIEKKAVYDLTSGDIKTIKQRLIGSIISNNKYYHDKLQEYKVIVVIHGDAYKFFMKDLNNTAYNFDKNLKKEKSELQKRFQSLAKLYDVKFEVCSVGIKHRELNPKAFYPFVTIIHNAISGLVDAQHDGYAYVPVF